MIERRPLRGSSWSALLSFRDEAYLRHELGAALLPGEPATSLDAAAKVVRVGGREVPYDALVLATGSRVFGASRLYSGRLASDRSSASRTSTVRYGRCSHR